MDADEFDGLEGLYADPNGPAYQQTETRSGPPLDYVADKLSESLRALHRLHSQLQTLAARMTADSTLGPDSMAEDLVYGVEAAFHQACVSYLALQNMLAHANPPEFAERLLAMDRDEFDGWLDDIARGGSVT